MHTVTVIARDTFPYAGITRFAGDVFHASAEDARVLALIGKVDQAPSMDELDASEDVVPHTPRRRLRRKDIVPEP